MNILLEELLDRIPDREHLVIISLPEVRTVAMGHYADIQDQIADSLYKDVLSIGTSVVYPGSIRIIVGEREVLDDAT